MLTKVEFLKCINSIKETLDFQEKLDKVLDCVTSFPDCIESTINLLGKLMNENDEMIGYFIFELNFGLDYEEGMVTTKDDEPIDISTAEKLYEYLSTSN